MKAEDAEMWRMVLEASPKMRPYAGFWDWPDRQIKELGVVDCLLQAIREREGRDWIKEIEPGPSVYLPPDVIGITKTGTRVAFEVTELVDESMCAMSIDQNIRCQSLNWHNWQPEEMINRLESRLAEKGLIDFGKGNFESIVLVIHADEPQISLDQCGPAIVARQFIRRGQINEAYLIFAPRPMSAIYPYFRLSFG
jgi:hypothetical protein